MRDQIEKIFDARIRKVFKERRDLMNFFLKHERKRLVLDSLVEQVRLAEWTLGGKMNSDADGKAKFEAMVENTADLFCHAAIGNADLKVMSDAEKRRRSITPEKHLIEFEQEINEENAKVHRGQIIGQGWTPKAVNVPRGRQIPKLLKS